MKNINLFFLGLTVLFLGCEKDQETVHIIHPPKSISILCGNDQMGYANDLLSDSIVLEIIPSNKADLTKYSYYFRAKDYYPNVYAHDTIIDDKFYVYAFWKLNFVEQPQKITFYLLDNGNDYNAKSNKIDSLTISASIKPLWKEVFSASWGTLYDIHFSDDKNGILVGDLAFSSGYFKTNDGGKTWIPVNYNRNDLYQLCFSDSNNGFVIATNNWAFFTNNGGQSFFQGNWSPPIIGHRSSSDYYMLNSNKIFSVGGNATIAKSINGGITWSTYQGFTFKNYLYDITCTDDNTCYACGSIGKIVKTTDGGETWKEQEILLNNYLKKIYFLDNDFGFAGGQNGILLRTTNGGLKWEIIATGFKFPIIEIYFYTRDLGYIVSSTGEIGKTKDGGLNWELVNKDNYGVFELNKVLFKDHTLLGLQGGSIYKYELSNE